MVNKSFDHLIKRVRTPLSLDKASITKPPPPPTFNYRLDPVPAAGGGGAAASHTHMTLQELGFSSLNMLLYGSCGGDDRMPGGPYMYSGGGGGIIIGG